MPANSRWDLIRALKGKSELFHIHALVFVYANEGVRISKRRTGRPETR